MTEWTPFRNAASSVVVQHPNRSKPHVRFVSLAGEKVVWPISGEPESEVREALETEGYDIRKALNADRGLTIPTISQGAPECTNDNCNVPMLERDRDHSVGGTPTSPVVGFTFECAACGSRLNAYRHPS